MIMPDHLRQIYHQEEKVVWFTNPEADPKHPGYNRHHFSASKQIQDFFKEKGNGLVSILGPMGSGKSALLILLSQQSGLPFTAFFHRFDANRTGGAEVIKTWGNGNLIAATAYQTVQDIFASLNSAPTGSLIFVDEWQFCDSTKVNEDDMKQLKKLVLNKKLKIVIAGLDFSFKRDLWPNARVLIDSADFISVLTSRCSEKGCQNPAVYTQLNLGGKPASVNDDPVHVGNVLMEFFPMCPKHHQLRG